MNMAKYASYLNLCDLKRVCEKFHLEEDSLVNRIVDEEANPIVVKDEHDQIYGFALHLPTENKISEIVTKKPKITINALIKFTKKKNPNIAFEVHDKDILTQLPPLTKKGFKPKYNNGRWLCSADNSLQQK